MPPDKANSTFLAPTRLGVTLVPISRVMLIGRCLLAPFADMIGEIAPGTECDFVLFNNLVELADEPPHQIGEYAFQILALPMRLIVPEFDYFGLDYADLEGAKKLFANACDRLDICLEAAAAWNVRHGIETYVMNFMLPQSNSDGRLLPRYDLRNMTHLFQRLNEHLEQRVATYRNMHIVDIDSVAASMGRRHVQDDTLWLLSHASVLFDHDPHYDQARLEPPPRRPSEIFDLKLPQFVRELWFEIVAMHRTQRQTDAVKMVIVDLDDTVWRGVAAERDHLDQYETEGWPLGVVEALMYLKRRGMVLAIASKNEMEHVKRAFDVLYHARIRLEDFAITKINWAPKVENIAAILEEANLLPKNVVFIDDNPVERAAVAAAFPDLRILGDDLYAVRRILLWSSETQVAAITPESTRRTEMVQAHVARETARKATSREEFLRTLDVQVRLFDVAPDDTPFVRAFELLNKTNQFNTTGRRWVDAELHTAMAAGLDLIAFTVADIYTDYGLVGVVLLDRETIAQFVMSCRVLGLDIERAVLASLQRRVARQGAERLHAVLETTPHNHACRDVYGNAEFTKAEVTSIGGLWTLDMRHLIGIPGHIEVTDIAAMTSA